MEEDKTNIGYLDENNNHSIDSDHNPNNNLNAEDNIHYANNINNHQDNNSNLSNNSSNNSGGGSGGQFITKDIVKISIEKEMQQSYVNYAMSVIVGRALPDVRDGLKPVHRRVLFSMHETSNDWNRAYKKSARIVGDVIGKYHPHGDTAIYDTMVRMAQDFSLRYTLIDGQGNFGSVDGDAPAAMRYTEVRMRKITHEMLADIDKDTVDFVANYDGNEREPSVLPTKIPNLLINGSVGIAVGMATNIPPHNLSEIIDGCLLLLDNPDIDIDALIDCIPAPDFPTAGLILGVRDIRQGYKTGRGRVVMRARTHFETLGRDKTAIIIDELPYQVNKARLCEKIGELIREKVIEGISDLRDESDKSGMRVFIELKRGENEHVILNMLYKHTQMQDSFGINMVALVDGQPRLLNLKEALNYFIMHRRSVIVRRTMFELRKALERIHVLEGLAIALKNVDEIIQLIKESPNPITAKERLMAKHWQSELVNEMLERAKQNANNDVLVNLLNKNNKNKALIGKAGNEVEDDLLNARVFGASLEGYLLTDTQAQAILELRLQRLTGLEQDKIFDEYNNLITLINDLSDIIASPMRVNQIIRSELTIIKEQFGDVRRSEIIQAEIDIDNEDLIARRDLIVTMSRDGYIKTQSPEEYKAQKRGGRGKSAANLKENDLIQNIFIANTHNYLLCFSDKGRVHWLKVYNIPEGSRTNRGKPIVNLLSLEEGEKITSILPVSEFKENLFVFMTTRLGVVKKVVLSAFSHTSVRGIIAINLDEGDSLVAVAITNGKQEIMIFSSAGKAVRFNEVEVRSSGRASHGVRGIKLNNNAYVVSMLATSNPEAKVLTATTNGYGKRTSIGEYRLASRATQGVKAIGESARNGQLIAAVLVEDHEEILMITSGGVLIRTKVSDIRDSHRATQGVRLIDLDDNEQLVDLTVVSDIASDDSIEANDTSDADKLPDVISNFDSIINNDSSTDSNSSYDFGGDVSDTSNEDDTSS